MKKSFFIALVLFFTLSTTMVFAGNKNVKPGARKSNDPAKTENKLSEAELTCLTNRVEEIRDMDKSDMSSAEKQALKKELKEIKSNVKKGGGVYIGGAALILIIILIIILV